jgi:hypothetical protein
MRQPVMLTAVRVGCFAMCGALITIGVVFLILSVIGGITVILDPVSFIATLLGLATLFVVIWMTCPLGKKIRGEQNE